MNLESSHEGIVHVTNLICVLTYYCAPIYIILIYLTLLWVFCVFVYSRVLVYKTINVSFLCPRVLVHAFTLILINTPIYNNTPTHTHTHTHTHTRARAPTHTMITSLLACL